MTKPRNRKINEKNAAWNKSPNCDCNDFDCKMKHRICNLCNRKMHYDAHISNFNHIFSKELEWNKDHIIDKQFGGTNRKDNFIATHPSCNDKKSKSEF